MNQAQLDVDRRWAYLLGVDPEMLRTPGTHYARDSHPEDKAWMGYAVYFFAVRPHNTDTTVVAGTSQLCNLVEQRLSETNADIAQVLVDVAGKAGCEEHYIAEVLVSDPRDLTLASPSGDVIDIQRNPKETDWDGVPLIDNVDGPIFVTKDDRGITSWAGVKQVSPWARDIQIATRPDARKQGLAYKSASVAMRAIISQGITPYYAHFSSNEASARLAKALGLKPWGKAIFAESKLPDSVRLKHYDH